MRTIRVALAVATFLLVVAGALFAASRQSSSVAPLTQDGHNVCTTTAIGDGHRWLTAAHCVDEPVAIKGEIASVILRDVINDVAFLQTQKVSAPPLRLATRAPEVEDPVKMIGYPFGWPFQATVFGSVAALKGDLWPGEPPYTVFQIAGAPGNSGSAILNSRGEVISVLQVVADRMPDRGRFAGMLGGVTFETLRRYRGYFDAE